jgi:hypothetical protein
VRLDVKILTNPTIAIDQMVAAMRQVYARILQMGWLTADVLR